jgi:hypothetical protein
MKWDTIIHQLTHCSALPVGALEDRAQRRFAPGARVGIDTAGKPDGLWLALGYLWLQVALGYDMTFRVRHFGASSLRPCSFHMYRACAPISKEVLWCSRLRKPTYADCRDGKYRDKLLMLLDIAAIQAFHRRYRMAHLPHQAFREAVDWTTVAAHFAGIFVLISADILDTCNYRWLHSWELSSACVWRPKDLQLTLHALPERDVKARVAACYARLQNRFLTPLRKA